MMKLSNRLETIASFVRKGSKIADIGTDHGYVPIYLVENQTAVSALAMDVREGPLRRAEAHIHEAGLMEKIKTRRSDGLASLLPGEADTVIIAGMGGNLLIHILEGGRPLWEQVDHWVLSPQSDISRVRHYLEEHGFFIRREAMVAEDGKYYTVMEAGRGNMDWKKESYYCYGKLLIEARDQTLADFLEKEKATLENIADSLNRQGRKSESAEKRLSEILQKLRVIEEARHEML